MVAKAKRGLGQHFLEAAWVRRLVQIIAPRPDDTFLEVGPGRGVLTGALAYAGARVVAVELDQDLVTHLETLAPAGVTVVHADFLKTRIEDLPGFAALPPGGLRIVGNLPYNVGSAILLKLLRFSHRHSSARDAVVMLQKEVAERVTAGPGGRDWGALAVATSLHAEARLALTVPPGAFRPMPKVTSAVVSLRFRPSRIVIRNQEVFDRLVRTIFTQRRKTSLNATRRFVTELSVLPPEVIFTRAGVDPRVRPAELGLPELARLAEVVSSSLRLPTAGAMLSFVDLPPLRVSPSRPPTQPGHDE